MKALIIGTAAILLIAFAGIYQYNSNSTQLELQKWEITYGLECQRYGRIGWELNDRHLNDSDIYKMVAVMDSGYFQDLCRPYEGSKHIKQVYFEMSNNPSLNDISPLLKALKRNFSETLELISMQFGENLMEEWDKNFQDYYFAEKVSTVQFSFQNDQTSDITHFTNSIKNNKNMKEVSLDITRNHVSGESIQNLVTFFQNNKKNNQTVSLYLGFNAKGNTEQVRNGFIDIINNSPKLYQLDLGLQNYLLSESYLETLSDALYDRIINGKLFNISLNLTNCGHTYKRVQQIFHQVAQLDPYQFHITMG